MSTVETAIITKYTNKYHGLTPRYLWVYAEEKKDVSLDHAPVMSWESGVENLEQLHTEPIKEKGIVNKEEEKGECAIVVEIDKADECGLCNIREILENLLLTEAAKKIERFLITKKAIYLDKAIELTHEDDPVSCYKLRKIAKKTEVNRGKVSQNQ